MCASQSCSRPSASTHRTRRWLPISANAPSRCADAYGQPFVSTLVARYRTECALPTAELACYAC
eukprot:2604316-Pyramimonas_sp.AAC.1